MKKPRFGGAFLLVISTKEPSDQDARNLRTYSPSVNNDAFPPAAVVLIVTVFSVANRGT